jgi:4-amino-4-deoxy-L-arabinose transferase-like glycosyltransferase
MKRFFVNQRIFYMLEKLRQVISTPLSGRYYILLGLFSMTLAIKICIFSFATDPIIFSKYPYFAQQIAQGRDIGERLVDLSPAYLYINVIFYLVFGTNWELLAILQILIGSLNGLVIYAIGEKLLGKYVGIMAAVILAFYGNMTLIELTLEPETFVIFFNSLAVLALLWAKQDPIWRLRSPKAEDTANTPQESMLLRKLPWRWLTAGLLIGLAVITKPNALLIIPGALIWIWWDDVKASQRVIASLCLLLGAAILISPITVRNYAKFHDMILITADGGKVFFHGNGPGATGMDRADLPHQGFLEEGQSEPDYAHALFRNTARALSGKPLKPSECSKYWFHHTLDYMAAHPHAAFLLELKKVCFFWSNYEVHDIDSIYKNYITIQSWPLIPFAAIAVLGIMGMVSAARQVKKLLLPYWMILIYFVSVLVFFAASRYRLPAVPYLSIFAALTLSNLYRQMRDRQWRKWAVHVVAITILTAGTLLPFRDDIVRFDRWQQATRIHYSLGGIMFFNNGEYQKAISEFQKSIDIDPNFVAAHNYLGKSYAILNDYARAERAFQKVIRYAPEVDEGYMNLGILYELRGEIPQAIVYLRKAIELNPKNKKAKSHLQALMALPAKH